MAKDQFEFSIKAKDKDSAEKLKIDENDGATFGSTAAADGEVVTLLDSLNMTLTQSDIGKPTATPLQKQREMQQDIPTTRISISWR